MKESQTTDKNARGQAPAETERAVALPQHPHRGGAAGALRPSGFWCQSDR